MMKLFSKQVIRFIVLFCLLNFVVIIVLKRVANPYAENEIYEVKYADFLKNKTTYNTLFFGSSRTYRHVNPQLIDAGLQEYQVKSYNLGAPATYNPEALFLYEDFLKHKAAKTATKYAFIELTEFTPIAFENMFSRRSYYYLNTEYLKVALRYYGASGNYGLPKKVVSAYPFVQGFLLNNIIPFNPWKTPEEDFHINETTAGFYALDADLAKNKSPELADRNNALLRDTTCIAKRKQTQLKELAKKAKNKAYAALLNQLVAKSKKKGIQLYFIIPPRNENAAMFAYLKEKIKEDRVIDFSNPEAYPDLYLAKNNFDVAHFNSKGAALYSTYLAKAIKDKLSHQTTPALALSKNN